MVTTQVRLPAPLQTRPEPEDAAWDSGPAASCCYQQGCACRLGLSGGLGSRWTFG